MIRTNVLEAPKRWVTAHDGTGKISFVRPFSSEHFDTDLSFVDYVELPPGTSIGEHTHGENEEIYFIVEGRGTMRTNDEVYGVRAGDLIVNRRGWSHGLENDTPDPLRVLVWEIAAHP